MRGFTSGIRLAGVAALVGLASCATDLAVEPDRAASADAPASLHEQLLVMDTHLDTPAFFARPDYSLIADNRLTAPGTHVDLPRMQEGGLDGGFWVIYTPQGPLDPAGFAAARDAALIRATEIREAAARHNAHFELAFHADDAERIAASGKRVIYQSLENAYPLGMDLSLLETFYRLGVRMAGPVHFANNQLADSATDPAGPQWGGLSPLGREFVKEANRLGIVLDGSHAHDLALENMIELSETPVILSHSGVSAIYEHPRNVSDELLLKLAARGGVIQINSVGSYLEALAESEERVSALAALDASVGGDPRALEGPAREAYVVARLEINRTWPAARSSFDTFASHLLHALELVGPDHVGLGADWDGGGGVEGMEDVASLPKVTGLMLGAGYSEADIAKVWSGNMLRLLRAAEEAATAGASSLPTVR